MELDPDPDPDTDDDTNGGGESTIVRQDDNTWGPRGNEAEQKNQALQTVHKPNPNPLETHTNRSRT